MYRAYSGSIRCAAALWLTVAMAACGGTSTPFDGGEDIALDISSDASIPGDADRIVDVTTVADVLDVPDAPDTADVPDAADVADAGDVVHAPDAQPDVVCRDGAVCGTECVYLSSDANHCGSCDRRCASPTNGTATCTGGECGVVCDDGYVASGNVCAPAPPRPIAPLSTATVTSRRPTLHWSLGAVSDGARVELCRDRACTVSIEQFDAVGTAGAPAIDLPAGVVFWRLTGLFAGAVNTANGPTWQFTVGPRSAPVDTSWGTVPDVNGDGFADVFVGASSADGNATGRAYVYLGSVGGLATMPAVSLLGPDGLGGSFGSSLASAGDVNGDGYSDFIVGAHGAATYTGRAYVYLGSASGLATSPASILTGPDGAYGVFGASVASAGDVNGDGYADVIVGATGTTTSRTGRAFVYLGSARGLATTPAVSLTDPDGPGGSFGGSVASAGDLNGDGYSDVVVGAPLADNGVGKAYVYLGGTSGLAATPASTLSPTDASSVRFGVAVASAGDLNGDGIADMVIGEYNSLGVGHAYVYAGSSTGVASTPAIVLIGSDGPGSSFGFSVASAGDLNADGFADLIVGAPDASNYSGRAYVYLGSIDGVSGVPASALSGPDGPNGLFGAAVAGGGDVNGDTIPEVIVGAPWALGDQGRVYLYEETATGLDATPATMLDGRDPLNGFFGTCVARAGSLRRRSRNRFSRAALALTYPTG